jgi:hypothetical protein
MLTLQPHLARVFDPLNYAFRPRRSERDALFAARAYSRKLPFAAKADIRKFFDHTSVGEGPLCARGDAARAGSPSGRGGSPT